ncbi:methyl-accepting chemotaxis protein [Sphingomonas kaistensis]|uniref:Methyl-accepting chemotaxis protein n=1 Tax=Sphingomonas kaistensis TaxID=298708 RepID=A0A7X5Y4G5_9SPHN|nr:globin-coupled sensor protein [Sphingomonas kaistensis]NJC05022.1 methyl-accepting chemotaxis protein [Sphingomonas kaistensis]
MSDEIQTRLQFMNFTQAQRDRLSGMRDLLARLIPPALDRFYDKVRQTPSTSRFFRDGEHMRCAHAAQEKHWARIAEGRFDQAFSDSVQRIGAVHARIGLEPQWYIGAYSVVLEQLLEGIGREYGLLQRLRRGFRGPTQAELSAARVKAALLDMELSVSIYFAQSQVERSTAIAALSAALSTVAKGDLTADLGEMPDSFGAIKRDYDQAIARLRELVSGVADGAVHIQTGSSEIAQAAEDLARRTESTAATLEQTAAAVSQMDERLRATSTAAERSVRQADDTSATVANGRNVARQAVQAMEAVSASATGIDGVIEGLDKIAFQTRVLAMNAAVEAGRAGEAGRGFAVVADLVSALAMRAEEEAKKARTELTTTQTEIVSAVQAVHQVDGELQRISENVEAVHQLVSNIASDNQAQASAITEINSAVSSMDRATQQNAAMVEETSAAARNLAGEVSRLNGKTSQFTTQRAGGVVALAAARDERGLRQVA